MVRQQSPEVRRRLVERAALMLGRREPVTTRSLVHGLDVSTMAVYTYFGGMDGLWGAVRQEAFSRLGQRLAAVPDDRDPVRRLAALGVAYVENAVANPDLYRVMFDAAFPLPEPGLADATFGPVVAAAGAARSAGRFSAAQDPLDVATRFWAVGHGLASLAVSGVLAPADVARHGPVTAAALFVACGDDPRRAERSVAAAWRGALLVGPATGGTQSSGASQTTPLTRTTQP